MAEDTVRYGAGRLPYVGNGGEKSTEAASTTVEKEDPQTKIKFEVTEDDTPLTDAEVVKKDSRGE